MTDIPDDIPDDITDDVTGELPAPDPDLAAWYAAQPTPAMPADVWQRLQAALAAEAPLGRSATEAVAAGAPASTAAGAAVVDLDAQREERRSRRLWPVLGAAAGLVLVGAVVLPVIRGGEPAPIVADGTATTQTEQPTDSGTGDPLVASPPAAASPGTEPGPGQPGVTAEPTITSEPTADPEPTTAIDTTIVPATMVMASGTQYTEGDLLGQLDGLLASAGYAAPESMATPRIANSSASPSPLPGGGVTADLAALAACLEALRGSPLDLPALVVDRATYQGVDSAIVIMLRALSGESGSAPPTTESSAPPLPEPTAAETLLDVYVVGADCTGDDVSRAMRFTHRVG